jgi:hypothetical protein
MSALAIADKFPSQSISIWVFSGAVKKKPRMEPVKNLLFLAKGGTMGDLKPLAILAVIAARSSKTRVTFVHRANTHFLFLDKFARFMIGDNYQEHLRIMTLPDIRRINPELKEVNTNPFDMSTFDQYVSFGQIAEMSSYEDYSVKLDFGDNGDSPNRFVSCLLSWYKPTATHFGSLYLPSRLTWSNTNDLREFTTRHRDKRIMTIAGSMQLPVPYNELFKWFETNAEFQRWAFILVGYDDLRTTEAAYYAPEQLMDKYFHHHQVLIVKDYVEYEDLMVFSDFFISNCGAGSVVIPLAAGVPQTCDWLENISGADKLSNLRSIGPALHHVGPRRMQNFPQVMEDITLNLDIYTTNAQKSAEMVKSETEMMLTNMARFFELASQSAELQQLLIETGAIPDEFGLGPCVLEINTKRQKQ